MFFDNKVMNELQPLWKIANNFELNRTETMEYSLKDVCTKLNKIVQSVDTNCAKRLALRPSSTLVSGAIKLYKEKVNQLCCDTQNFEREITTVNYKTHYHTESSDTDTNSSASTVPEEMMRQSNRTSTILGSSRKRSLSTDENVVPNKKRNSTENYDSTRSDDDAEKSTDTEDNHSNKSKNNNWVLHNEQNNENESSNSKFSEIDLNVNGENELLNRTYSINNDHNSEIDNIDLEANDAENEEPNIENNENSMNVVNDKQITNNKDTESDVQEEINKSNVSNDLNKTIDINKSNQGPEFEIGDKNHGNNDSSVIEIMSDTSKSSEASSTFEKLLDGFPYAMTMIFRHKRSKAPCRIMYNSVNPFIFEAI